MTYPADGGSRTITLDELVALNEEIAALIRAGVPLESSLSLLGSDLPGRLGKLTERLAERISSGESLSDAISAEGTALPDVYRRMVTAGLRCGRLSAALEAMADTARRLSELRKSTAQALIYPVMVVALAIGLFAFLVAFVLPKFALLELPGFAVLERMVALGASAPIWGTVGPILVIAVALWWWFWSRRASAIQHDHKRSLGAWLPWLGRVRFFSQSATFAELFSLLISHEVPMQEALRLAADATGEVQLTRAADQIASAVEQGEHIARDTPGMAELPPLMRSALCSGTSPQRLVEATRYAADTYRDRATSLVQSSRLLLPVLLTVTVGAAVTLLYVLALFIPYVQALKALSLE